MAAGMREASRRYAVASEQSVSVSVELLADLAPLLGF